MGVIALMKSSVKISGPGSHGPARARSQLFSQDLGNYQESKKKNKNGKKGLVRNQSK